jgi:hypothetical protein
MFRYSIPAGYKEMRITLDEFIELFNDNKEVLAFNHP